MLKTCKNIFLFEKKMNEDNKNSDEWVNHYTSNTLIDSKFNSVKCYTGQTNGGYVFGGFGSIIIISIISYTIITVTTIICKPKK